MGDTPPSACADVVMYEVGKSGLVIRRIEPSGATTQSASSAGASEAEKAATARRRDQALLDSYTSVQEIDRARDRNVEMLRGRIDSTDVRLRQLDQKEKDLERAIASHGRAPTPAAVQSDMDAVRAEQASLAANRTRLEKELADAQQRFDVDRSRWIELRAGR